MKSHLQPFFIFKFCTLEKKLSSCTIIAHKKKKWILSKCTGRAFLKMTYLDLSRILHFSLWNTSIIKECLFGWKCAIFFVSLCGNFLRKQYSPWFLFCEGRGVMIFQISNLRIQRKKFKIRGFRVLCCIFRGMLFLLGIIHLVKSKMDDPLDICWKEFSFKKWRFQEHQWSSMNNNSKKLVIQSTIYARTITALIIKTKREHRVFNSNDASLAFNLCFLLKEQASDFVLQ